MASVLTLKAVETAKADPLKRVEIGDGALPGLYLVIQPSGLKSWALRYRFGGKPRKLTIGPVIMKRDHSEVDGVLPFGQPMTLPEARRAAREALQLIAEGIDPVAEKKAAKAARAAAEKSDLDTVEQQAKSFVSRYCQPRNRSWREVERQFRAEINPHWGSRRVQEIAKRDVIELLDAIIDRGSPITANRVFATLRRFFGWLIERDVIQTSPCAGLKKPTPEAARERVLTDDEIRCFWKACDAFEYPFGPMWRLMLLTGQRRSEVAGMRKAELIDDNGPGWLIPSSRTKNGVEHFVPLAPMAASIVKEQPVIGPDELIFSTTGSTSVSGFSRSKARLDAEICKIMKGQVLKRGDDPNRVRVDSFTLHDLRRTMASGMAALGINLATIEKCLNHTSGSFGGIVGVYQRHDFKAEKRRALEAWEAHVLEICEGQDSSNVVKLSGGSVA